MKRLMVSVLLFLLFCLPGTADKLEYVHVRVVDVGQGLCCLIKLPNDKFMIYDAGAVKDDFTYQVTTQMEEFITNDSKKLELLVISHAHYDHTCSINDIFTEGMPYTVDRVFRTGRENIDSSIYGNDDVRDLNLKEGDDIPFGSEMYGEDGVNITFICGYDYAPSYWRTWDKGRKNSTSIVLRLEYANRSILFTGDTVGYDKDGEPDEEDERDCVAAERVMVDNSELPEAERIEINSDVMFAPHHGSKYSSSEAFINAVSPDYVIFPSGHYGLYGRTGYDHPTSDAAERYYKCGVNYNCMFRTDWGDDERTDLSDTSCSEWEYGRIVNEEADELYIDRPGDDHIDIYIFEDGRLWVGYVQPS